MDESDGHKSKSILNKKFLFDKLDNFVLHNITA